MGLPIPDLTQSSTKIRSYQFSATPLQPRIKQNPKNLAIQPVPAPSAQNHPEREANTGVPSTPAADRAHLEIRAYLRLEKSNPTPINPQVSTASAPKATEEIAPIPSRKYGRSHNTILPPLTLARQPKPSNRLPPHHPSRYGVRDECPHLPLSGRRWGHLILLGEPQ